MTLFGLASTTALLAGLALIGLSDHRSKRIPDRLSLPLIALGLAVGLAEERLTDALIGAALGYGALAAISTVHLRATRREGLGLGDAKLMAVGGAWCGWALLPATLLIAATGALVAVMLRPRESWREAIAFGPFLAIAIAAVRIWSLWA